jgi:hypothetical protein
VYFFSGTLFTLHIVCLLVSFQGCRWIAGSPSFHPPALSIYSGNNPHLATRHSWPLERRGQLSHLISASFLLMFWSCCKETSSLFIFCWEKSCLSFFQGNYTGDKVFDLLETASRFSSSLKGILLDGGSGLEAWWTPCTFWWPPWHPSGCSPQWPDSTSHADLTAFMSIVFRSLMSLDLNFFGVFHLGFTHLLTL